MTRSVNKNYARVQKEGGHLQHLLHIY